METINEILHELEEFSSLIASAIIRETTPYKDDISENQARIAYGAKWLRKMKADGLAKHARVGGRVLYSRHQLNCLREAERTQARLITHELHKK